MELFLIITKSCNFNCSYCYEKDKNFINGVISAKIVKKTLDFFLPQFKISGSCVRIFGGEPLLFFDIVKSIIEYIRKKSDVEIYLNTNGSLLNKKILTFFYKNKVRLIFSFDGTPETQNCNRPMRDGKRSYDVITNNDHFHALVSYPFLEVNQVAALERVDHLFRDFLHVLRLGFRNINFDAERGVYWSDEKLNILERELRKINLFYFKNSRAKNKKVFHIGYLENYFKNKDSIKKNVCPHRDRVVVMPNGDIFPCNAILEVNNEEYYKKMIVMNITNLNGFTFEDFLKKKIAVYVAANQALANNAKESILCNTIAAFQGGINERMLFKNEIKKTIAFKKSIDFFKGGFIEDNKR